jgi:hypothetical protein
MAERLGAASRPTGMRLRRIRSVLLGMALVGPMVLAGCGDDGSDRTGSTPREKASPSAAWCRTEDAPTKLAMADLDGDGTVEDVDFIPPGADCPGSLSSSVDGLEDAPTLDWTAPARPADTRVVEVPGRAGQLVLVLEQHPRGGFQAHLFGFADGKLEELEVAGGPIFPFVATDVLSTPLTATCTSGGFEVTEARAHEPVGVVPAWDIDRTTYTVAGNAVSRGATTEVADNVLDEQLRSQYRSLVEHRLFEGCRSGS